MKRLAAVVGAIALLFVTLPVAPAYAVELTGPPDAQGDYIVCNINAGEAVGNWSPENFGSTTYTVIRYRCAWGGANTPTEFAITTAQSPGTWVGGDPGNQTGECLLGSTSTGVFRSMVIDAGDQTIEGTFCHGPDSTGSEATKIANRHLVDDDVRFTYTTSGGGTRPGRATVTQSNTMPSWPADWYPGGAAILDDAPAPAGSCSRTLDNNGGSYFGTFRLVMDEATPEGVTDTYSWDFGDESTPATTLVAQHVYGNTLDEMPEGGWIAEVTVTRTGDGVIYAATEQEVSCSVRVDFRNPGQSDAGSGTTPDEDDSDCPSGFGWLNPLAILDVLRCLFIPSEEAVNSLGELWGDMTTKAPFSWAYEVVTLPGDFLSDMANGAEDAHSGNGTATCKDLTGDAFDQEGENYEYTNCQAETALGVSSDGSPFGIIRGIFYFLFILCTALAVYRVVVWTVS